jgi:hypothetical protein
VSLKIDRFELEFKTHGELVPESTFINLMPEHRPQTVHHIRMWAQSRGEVFREMEFKIL